MSRRITVRYVLKL